MDNAILIIAGDAIDTSLGVVLGISTMCAAAIGNIVSDVAGIMLGTVVEDCAAQLNMPTPNLTAAQRQLRSVRFANQFGCAVGLVVGCILGMFPLLWMDPNKVQVKKQEAHLDAIFRDVVQEAGSLVGAQRMRLFLQVQDASTTPTPHGKYLYAKFSDQKMRIPLGRGIVSRAALTGEAWKIDHVREEPDWDADIAKDAETMICVPVLDGNGKSIAVLQAINKIGKGQTGDEQQQQPWMVDDSNNNNNNKPRAFLQQDVQILKALASHIGVSLQQLYETAGEQENELRLRDTIRVLKKYGLEGLKGEAPVTPVSRKIALFPDD